MKIYYKECEKVPLEIQIDRNIHQLKVLSKEAIDILYEDGLLSSNYIDELAFRIHKYCIRELKTLKKIFYHSHLGYKKRCPFEWTPECQLTFQLLKIYS